MPVFQANVLAGRFTAEQKKLLGRALGSSLVTAFGVPPDDRFHMISEHAEGEIFLDPTFMGMNRDPATAIFITVYLGAHRPLDDKRCLVKAISDARVAVLNISADDVFITLVAIPNENFHSAEVNYSSLTAYCDG